MAINPRPQLEPIPLPDSPGLLGGWGRKLELTLVRFVASVYNLVMGPFWAARDDAMDYLFEKTAERVRPFLLPYLDSIERIPNLPPSVRDTISQLRGTEPLTLTAITVAVVISAIVGAVMGTIQPFIRLGAYQSEVVAHSARMTPGEAFTAWRRGGLGYDSYKNQFLHGGWSEELRTAWESILAPLVPVSDIATLYVRGEVSEGAFNTKLTQRGYKPDQISNIKTLLHVIPPLPDIIRMAVREAFTPDIVSRFQLHAELPVEMVEWAAKQGLSSEWARAYWAAHWQLPSLQMGYEMLHRGEIEQGEMEMLIKAHDVSPFWRDKLINISYNPYTRVDVRRMFDTGVIGIEEVYQNYRDLGSDHEKATNLTNFTVALSQASERDLTKTEIMYGYEHGFFSPDETDQLLASIGYDQVEADYYKTKVDYKRWQAMVKESVKQISQQYIANQISESDVYGQLGALNLPASQMNRYVIEWDLKKQAKTKRLTAERLTKFRVQEVINNDQFATEMSGIGYSQKYIEWFLESMGKS